MGFLSNLPIDPGVLFVSLLVGSVVTAAAYAVWRDSRPSPENDFASDDTDTEDNPLLAPHSTTASYTTPFAIYPAIRTFYRPHSHAEKLPAIADLPLLVFIHGLGGSLAQFAPLLGSFAHVAPCFGIDLPGHGESEFEPRDGEVYGTSALKVLWRTAIGTACKEQGHRRVVLVGHSYGGSLAALLATDTRFKDMGVEVAGVVAVCPKAEPPSQADALKAKLFLALPDGVVDAVRWWDQRGGTESRSVRRFVGEGAGRELKVMQLRFNRQSKTPVWKKMVLGALPEFDARGRGIGGLPGKETWGKVHVPLFLIAGEADHVTRPEEVDKIKSFLHVKTGDLKTRPKSEAIPTADPTHIGSASAQNDSSTATSKSLTTTTTTTRNTPSSSVLKAAILPAPASHALLYSHTTHRTLAGLIEDFLSSHISPHLSLGWQLQQLTTTGKWDVKNLEKWQRTLAVSGPIGPKTQPNLLRALKTMREQDEEHSPTVFVQRWGGKVYAVVDISHDAPVYRTRTLEEGGVEYIKFPTVSKVPPTRAEVKEFVALVDRLREEMAAQDAQKNEEKAIAVHCHYGYNRTGFFICAYLIERCGFGVQDALDEFRRAKPPGIRHEHFIDMLWVRYTVGLKRAGTVEVEAEGAMNGMVHGEDSEG